MKNKNYLFVLNILYKILAVLILAYFTIVLYELKQEMAVMKTYLSEHNSKIMQLENRLEDAESLVKENTDHVDNIVYALLKGDW